MARSALLLFLVLGACGRAETGNARLATKVPSSRPTSVVATVHVAPVPAGSTADVRPLHAPASRATTECRSPAEPGCHACCFESTATRCKFEAWVPDGVSDEDLAGIEPWYNAVSQQDGPCPTNCPHCAQCSKRSEDELRDLGEHRDCNCAKAPGIDPCMEPESCDCYCERYAALTSACGPKVP